MIDALIQGRMHAAAKAGTSKNGASYATATVRVALDGESVFASVIAFDSTARAALLALEVGDSVALAGELKPKVFTPRDGAPRVSLDLVAHSVLTVYNVRRKRSAVETNREA